jgi:serine/threonine protein kinase
MLPSTQDYKIALMIGADSFRTLENVEVVMNPLYLEEPWYSTGGLAIVFKIKLQGKAYALKCFHKESPERQFRLRRIANYIKQNPSPFLVEFDYLDNELWVETNGQGQGYPVVLMEWIEGKTLDNYLEELCSESKTIFSTTVHTRLKDLYFHFSSLSEWLIFEPIAHGDLKHDNIIVTTSGGLKLIDYDGMFIPEFEGMIATELGSPCYQHPDRTKESFGCTLDEFSIVVILTTLYAIYENPELFRTYYNGDGLLFSDQDLNDLDSSDLLLQLKSLKKGYFHLILDCLRKIYVRNDIFSIESIFANTEFRQWKKRKSDISFNDKLILDKLLWRFKGEVEYREFLLSKGGNTGGDVLPFWVLNASDWRDLSNSHSFIWSSEWISRYEPFWDWEVLSENSSIVFSEELIGQFKDKWNMRLISNSSLLPTDISLMDNDENWNDWYELSRDCSLPWTGEFIEKFEYRWNWEQLSLNSSLPWSGELVEKFKMQWDWAFLSTNKSLPWSKQFVEKFEYQWDWSSLSANETLPWSEEFIRDFEHRWDWWTLSHNRSLPWSRDLIEQFEAKWNWNGLSWNYALPWRSIFKNYLEKWNWDTLSDNKSLPWSNSFIFEYEDKWDWQKLSENSAIMLDGEIIETYKDKWDWKSISKRQFLPWSRDFIKKYEDRWDWNVLSGATWIPFSYTLLVEFQERWIWWKLQNNKSILWVEKAIREFEGKLFNINYITLGSPQKNIILEEDGIYLLEGFKEKRYELYLGGNFYLSEKFIIDFKDRFSSGFYLRNELLPWSIEILKAFRNDKELSSLFYDSMRPSYEFVRFAKMCHPISVIKDRGKFSIDDVVRVLHDWWDWGLLSSSISLTWSIQLIGEFEDKWDWEKMSSNKSLPWSLELIDRYRDRWDFQALSGNESLVWSQELIGEFKDRWNCRIISTNRSIPWSFELICQYDALWDWDRLSKNDSIVWTGELIHYCQERLNWATISRNENLPSSEEFIRQFSERWDWATLSRRENLPWSKEFISEYQDRWDWPALSRNENLPSSEEFIREFSERWDWPALSRRENLLWSEGFIKEFQDRWDWVALSRRENRLWSEEFIREFQDRWDWVALSRRENRLWSEEFIREFQDRWDWVALSRRENLLWSEEFIREFQDRWDWVALSRRENLPWSVEFVREFKDKWDWCILAEAAYPPWSIEFISEYRDELMEHSYELSRNRALPWSMGLLQKFENVWDWKCICSIDGFPWTVEIFDTYRRRMVYSVNHHGEEIFFDYLERSPQGMQFKEKFYRNRYIVETNRSKNSDKQSF